MSEYEIYHKIKKTPVLADMHYVTREQAEAVIPVLEEDHPEFRGKLAVRKKRSQRRAAD